MIYIVEDDSSIRELVAYTLNSQGMEAEGFECPSAFFKALDKKMPDLVLLDIMLPEMDGLSVLRKLKGTPACSRLPVIMLTAKGSEYDTVMGLDSGADDYIPKPFRPRELLMRIKNVLRRTGSGGGLVRLGRVEVDTVRGTATKDGRDLNLSALEYRLLLMFLNHPGALLTRSQLLEGIWDIAGDFVNDNTLTVYIKRLREKIEDDPQNPALIKTVRGLGYKAEMR